MAKMLTFDEMLGVIVNEQWPGYHAFMGMAEGLATGMASLIAERTGCTYRPAHFDKGGTMAALSPRTINEKIPRELANLDPDGEWQPRAADCST